MRNGGREHAHCRGTALLEVLIALVVFSLGMLGLAGLQTLSLQFNTSAYYRTQATTLAYGLADRMRANRQAALDGEYAGDIEDRPPPAIRPAAPAAHRPRIWRPGATRWRASFRTAPARLRPTARLSPSPCSGTTATARCPHAIRFHDGAMNLSLHHSPAATRMTRRRARAVARRIDDRDGARAGADGRHDPGVSREPRHLFLQRQPVADSGERALRGRSRRGQRAHGRLPRLPVERRRAGQPGRRRQSLP